MFVTNIARCRDIKKPQVVLEISLHFTSLGLDSHAWFDLNTFRAAWFQRFSQKKEQFSVALPTP